MKRHSNDFDLTSAFKEFFNIQAYEPIIEWAKKNINFSKDVSAQRNNLDFDLYPYQMDIIKEWEDLESIKTVTFVCPEQMRKNQYLCGRPVVAYGL